MPHADRFADLAASLAAVEQVELLTLKGHLVVEAALTTVLEARLLLHDGELPRLTFGTLLDLALPTMLLGPDAGRSLRRRIVLLNEMRNAYAHRLEPGDLIPRMREFVQLAGPVSQWPADSSGQRALYRGAIQHLIGYVAALADIFTKAPRELAALQVKIREIE